MGENKYDHTCYACKYLMKIPVERYICCLIEDDINCQIKEDIDSRCPSKGPYKTYLVINR